MANVYRIASAALSPVLPIWLGLRRLNGKEDPKRIKERYGIASQARPAGTLVWLHAASVGEANSVLLLMEKIRERFPALSLLLTTGTVTSANLMQKRLPKGVLHQYVPLDSPQFTERFIRHWKPDIALWVESEFWPNLIASANEWQCFMGVINARMGERSFKFWQKHPSLIRSMLESFDCTFAQSDADAARLRNLGADPVLSVGNLKYDAALLPCDESELLALKNQLGNRPLWLAASTHPGEETMMAKTHSLLAGTRPSLLTVIVPRHPERGPAIAAELGKSARVALRSKRDAIKADTEIYIADTLGELGLFYRLCEIVFMGGSLIKHGGQNPLEPARLSCAILTGPHTHNFADIYKEMEQARTILRVNNPEALAAQIDQFFHKPDIKSGLESRARQWVEQKNGAAERLLEVLSSVLAPRRKAS